MLFTCHRIKGVRFTCVYLFPTCLQVSIYLLYFFPSVLFHTHNEQFNQGLFIDLSETVVAAALRKVLLFTTKIKVINYKRNILGLLFKFHVLQILIIIDHYWPLPLTLLAVLPHAERTLSAGVTDSGSLDVTAKMRGQAGFVCSLKVFIKSLCIGVFHQVSLRCCVSSSLSVLLCLIKSLWTAMSHQVSLHCCLIQSLCTAMSHQVPLHCCVSSSLSALLCFIKSLCTAVSHQVSLHCGVSSGLSTLLYLIKSLCTAVSSSLSALRCLIKSLYTAMSHQVSLHCYVSIRSRGAFVYLNILMTFKSINY